MAIPRTLLRLAAAALLLSPTEGRGQAGEPPCVGPASLVRVDHVVAVVSHLGTASGTYRESGFTLKEGRRHPNGLRNRHVKFADGTALEIMAVDGPATDAMARGYEAALHGGEGGVFLALTGDEDALLGAADRVGLRAHRSRQGAFGYVTFPDPGSKAVFNVRYDRPVDDAEVLRHGNGAAGIQVVWVEASTEVGHLLTALGALPCGRRRAPDGRLADAYGVGQVTVAILPPRPGYRTRVVGVTLSTDGSGTGTGGQGGWVHGLWVGLDPG